MLTIAQAELFLATAALVVWTVVTVVSVPAIWKMQPINRQRAVFLLAVIDVTALQLVIRSVEDVYGLPADLVEITGAVARGMLLIVGLALLLTWHKQGAPAKPGH